MAFMFKCVPFCSSNSKSRGSIYFVTPTQAQAQHERGQAEGARTLLTHSVRALDAKATMLLL